MVGFAPVLAGPGYVVGWVTDILGFRQRPLGARLMWSVPLSFGVTTMLAVMVGKYGSLATACWAIWGMGLLAAGMIAGDLLRGEQVRMNRWVVAGGLLFTLLVVGELVDIGIGNKLYMSVTVLDQSLRTAFVDAVLRTGVPPGNPLYWTISVDGVGHAAPMRYYYFWYVVCALVAKVMGVSARAAMMASCVWSGFGLAAVVGLYCKHFLRAPNAGGSIRRRTWITIALLAVTGMDILPVIAQYFQGKPTKPDMEWWSPEQVTSWLDSMLWVPHHLASLVCCVFGFLLVWMSWSRGWREKVLCGVLAGVGFAASFGLSTYVSVAFGMLMVAWLLLALGWKEGRSRCPALLTAGLVAVLLLLPYLRELRAAGPNAEGKTTLFALSARRMIDADLLKDLPGFKQLRQRSVEAEEGTAVLLLMVPGYMAELGFFGLVLAVVMLRLGKEGGDAERTAVHLVMSGLLVSSFVRSTVIGTNDFGMRSMLIPQFFLLLLGGLLMDGTIGVGRRGLKVGLGALIVLGLTGTVYQAGLLRLYLPVQDGLQRQNLGGLGERNMALREVLTGLEERTPKDAVVQYNTDQPRDFFNFAQLLNTPRQTVNAMPECDIAFGGDPGPCEGIEAEVKILYAGAGGLDGWSRSGRRS